MMNKEIYIQLQDTEWQFDYIDHDRELPVLFRAKETIDEMIEL